MLFVSYCHVGTNPLIRKHSLQLVVWKCYSTCPDLLIDLSHLILKLCCMCVCGGSPLVGVDISGTNWCWHANTNLELDLSVTDGINTWHGYVYWVLGFTLHANNVFPYNLGPSIVKLSTDHVFSTITFVCLVLYISFVSMLANLLQCMYIHCIYLRYTYLYNCHSLPSLHSCNQQCPLV